MINALEGTTITIGNGSLLSNNIEIHSTDYHGIYDKKGERINSGKNVIIGNHVWVGLGVKILKGSIISDGSVVGASSLVAGSFLEKNVIIAGNPAKVIRHFIFWSHKRLDKCLVPEELK